MRPAANDPSPPPPPPPEKHVAEQFWADDEKPAAAGDPSPPEGNNPTPVSEPTPAEPPVETPPAKALKNAKLWPVYFFLSLFACCGISVGLVGLGMLIDSARFASGAVATTGHVERLDTETEASGENSETKTYAVFTFQDAGGQAHTVKTTESDGNDGLAVGDEVAVLYHTDTPDSARLSGFEHQWSGGLWLCGFSLIFVLFPLFFALVIRASTAPGKPASKDGTGATINDPPLTDESHGKRDLSSPRARKVVKLVGGLFATAGLAMLAVAIASTYFTWRLVQTAVPATGTVIRLNAHTGSERKNRTTYAPVFTFTDQKGTQRTINSHLYSNSNDYTVGQTVPVLYDPASPQSAVIDDFMQLWFMGVFLGGMGTVFTAVGSLVFILAVRAARKANAATASASQDAKTGKPGGETKSAESDSATPPAPRSHRY